MLPLRTLTTLISPRGYLVGAVAAALAALLIGAPTAVIPTPFFMRMTPTRSQNYLFLALTALLAGVVAATYTAPRRSAIAVPPGGEGRLTAGGILSSLAIGCPICNKLVVLALGVGGALRYFEPVQPLLGLASLALLGVTAWLRLRLLYRGCATCAT